MRCLRSDRRREGNDTGYDQELDTVYTVSFSCDVSWKREKNAWKACFVFFVHSFYLWYPLHPPFHALLSVLCSSKLLSVVGFPDKIVSLDVRLLSFPRCSCCSFVFHHFQPPPSQSVFCNSWKRFPICVLFV